MSTNQVAQIILDQLGANRFVAMTGAKNLLSHPDALSFRLSSTMTRNKSNYIKITLNANDLYDVSFNKIFKFAVKEVSSFSDVSAENLVSLFTNETGLAARL